MEKKGREREKGRGKREEERSRKDERENDELMWLMMPHVRQGPCLRAADNRSS